MATALEVCHEECDRLERRVIRLVIESKRLKEEVIKLMTEITVHSKGERQRINIELLEKRKEDFG